MAIPIKLEWIMPLILLMTVIYIIGKVNKGVSSESFTVGSRGERFIPGCCGTADVAT
jgi:hypothetical protein